MKKNYLQVLRAWSEQKELRMSETIDTIKNSKQYSTFYIAGNLYGINVMKVQEVTRALPMTDVPLSPHYVHGLINLRGQIATAVGLRELFAVQAEKQEDCMNVVCQVDGLLLSMLVDSIGDVMEVDESQFEAVPDTVPQEIRRYVSGIFKIEGSLLSVIEIGKISEAIQKQAA